MEKKSTPVAVGTPPNASLTEKPGTNSEAETDRKQIDSARKTRNMYVKLVISFAKKICLLLLGYGICYLNLSLTLPVIGVCSLIWYEHFKNQRAERVRKRIRASYLNQTELGDILKELPLWVSFPDRERAEWLNDIIGQLWPNLSNYVVKYCRTKIQTNIRKKFDSFRFEDIDFGNIPPRIDGVKVYNKLAAKNSIMIDFDVFYDGDCDLNFSVSGTQIGRIRDFQMGVEVRLVLKPLLFKTPLVGGLQLFFLNVPDIEFELEGITGIPGFNYLVRQKIEEIINKKLVFPNKITKRFTKSVEAAELKCVEAEGVLRVHVFEARDLEKKDVTGKSDPYVVLNVGAQQFKTPVIKRELNPQWDFYCEFIILDPEAQQLYFELFDQDEFNDDDFLGSGAVEISDVIKPGNTDRWFTLEKVKHGKLHMRFTWMTLVSTKQAMSAAIEETRRLRIENIHSALLTVYLDSAVDLPRIKSYRKPDAYVTLTVGKNQTKSRVKRHTCSPFWEQGLYVLVRNPQNDSLIVTIVDKHSESRLDKLVYNMRDLLHEPEMQISKREFQLQLHPASKIVLSLQLQVLHNCSYRETEDSDSDDEYRDDDNREDEEDIEKIERKNSKRLSNEPVRKDDLAFKVDVGSEGTPLLPLIHKFAPRVEQRGSIELSLTYSELRQKLLVTLHRVSNLPLKNPNDIPDPYVKLRLEGPGISPVKHRTKVVIDSCDPEYEETFEYLLSVSEIGAHRLVITVKNKKMFNSSILGQKILDLSTFVLTEERLRDWYDLHEEEVSD